MGSFPQTYNDPPFFGGGGGDSKPDVLRRKPSKLYDRANQSRQGSALVNVFINVLFERGLFFKSLPVKGCQTRVLVAAR